MDQRISIQPGVHFGKPCVGGTRIPVQNVLELVRDGVVFADVVRDFYPDLTIEDVQACLQYAIEVIALEDIHLTSAE